MSKPFITQDGTTLVRHPVTGQMLSVLTTEQLKRAAPKKLDAPLRWEGEEVEPEAGQ